MAHFVGLDVSVEFTSICIVTQAGRVVKETKVASEPGALAAALTADDLDLERIGLEAGPLSQWLYGALTQAGLPVVCVEARHMRAALAAQPNKSDRNDARGIAQMVRVGLYEPVHVKTQRSQELRMLLTGRKLLLEKLLDIDNDLRGTLRNFGLKVGAVSPGRFEARVRELVADAPRLRAIVSPILIARSALAAQYTVLHKMLLDLAKDDAVCRHLMTVPGVGPVVAMTFRATIDQPARFARSKAVGAHFGLTPRRYQSGELDYSGRISKCGDRMMRAALYEAAQALLTRVQKWSVLKAWAMRIAKTRGRGKATVAVARKLAVILHRIWTDGSTFRWTREGTAG